MLFMEITNIILKSAKYQFDRKKRNIIKQKILLSHIKMYKEILTFGDIEVEKKKFFTSIKVPFFK